MTLTREETCPSLNPVVIKFLFLLAAAPLLLTSCAHMFMKDHGFRKTQAVEINGASVTSALKPMGGSSGLAISAMIIATGTGTLDGPFLWRVEAEGLDGVHEWIRVNKARVTTETTRRSEPFPGQHLGINAKFEPIPGEKGRSFAKFQIPGKLQVFPREDGKTKIHLNISVKAAGKTETQWILFELEPETKWKNESVFLPTEIVKSFRGDPREWDW